MQKRKPKRQRQASETSDLEKLRAFLDAHKITYKKSDLPQLHREMRQVAELLLDAYVARERNGE